MESTFRNMFRALWISALITSLISSLYACLSLLTDTLLSRQELDIGDLLGKSSWLFPITFLIFEPVVWILTFALLQRLQRYKANKKDSQMKEIQIEIFPTVDELNRFAANEFIRLSGESIAESGRFTVALSGGSTPKKLFQLLNSDEFHSKIDWSKVHFFFGDERNVPITSEESNYRMANENLFTPLHISNENIHRFLNEEGDVKIIAEKMEKEIRDFFKLKESEFPRFDLVFLGMGSDGHTASLFPKTSALKEDKRIVVENFVEKFDTFRLTFAYPTINNAKNIIFLIAGEDKAEALHEVLNGEPNKEKFPSQGIAPSNGNLLFLIDENAGAKLA